MSDREYENLVGAAIIAPDQKTKDRALSRITCKAVASRAMFCGCGAVHDQKKIHVVEMIDAETKAEKTICALCPKCFESQLPVIETAVAKAARKYRSEAMKPNLVRVATWSGYQFIDDDSVIVTKWMQSSTGGQFYDISEPMTVRLAGELIARKVAEGIPRDHLTWRDANSVPKD